MGRSEPAAARAVTAICRKALCRDGADVRHSFAQGKAAKIVQPRRLVPASNVARNNIVGMLASPFNDRPSTGNRDVGTLTAEKDHDRMDAFNG
jgi:hypothetical protein